MLFSRGDVQVALSICVTTTAYKNRKAVKKEIYVKLVFKFMLSTYHFHSLRPMDDKTVTKQRQLLMKVKVPKARSNKLCLISQNCVTYNTFLLLESRTYQIIKWLNRMIVMFVPSLDFVVQVFPLALALSLEFWFLKWETTKPRKWKTRVEKRAQNSSLSWSSSFKLLRVTRHARAGHSISQNRGFSNHDQQSLRTEFCLIKKRGLAAVQLNNGQTHFSMPYSRGRPSLQKFPVASY